MDPHILENRSMHDNLSNKFWKLRMCPDDILLHYRLLWKNRLVEIPDGADSFQNTILALTTCINQVCIGYDIIYIYVIYNVYEA
jgi:hypothetical protein